MKSLIPLILLGVFFVGIIFLGPTCREYFGTRYADADRNIHVKSLSFVNGTIESLQRYQLAWSTADAAHRSSLKQIALTTAANVDEEELPPHLRSWIQKLRSSP